VSQVQERIVTLESATDISTRRALAAKTVASKYQARGHEMKRRLYDQTLDSAYAIGEIGTGAQHSQETAVHRRDELSMLRN
jgi:hypothetical protein